MTETPKLRPGAMPRQDLGWLSWKPVHPPADVIEASAPREDLAVHAGRSDDDVRRHDDHRAARPIPRIRFEDRDAPTWVRLVHGTHPDWSVARIAEELGVAGALWYVRLIVTQSCRRHTRHA